jgi:molybdopterin converting factor small subunit
MATVLLPRSLVALFVGAERRYDVPGATVAMVIDALDATIPGIRDRLVDAGPRLRPHINVYVAGTPAGLDTPVGDRETVHIIPAVSGGAPKVQASVRTGSRSMVRTRRVRPASVRTRADGMTPLG